MIMAYFEHKDCVQRNLDLRDCAIIIRRGGPQVKIMERRGALYIRFLK